MSLTTALIFLSSAIAPAALGPWDSVPKALKDVRITHIEASTKDTLLWLEPSERGETELNKYYKKMQSPNPPYKAKLDKWAQSPDEMTKAFVFSENLRIVMAEKSMGMGRADTNPILDAVPAVKIAAARELVSEALVSLAPLNPERVASELSKLWAPDSFVGDLWAAIGIRAASSMEAAPKNSKASIDIPTRGKGWLADAYRLAERNGMPRDGQRMNNLRFTTWDGNTLSLDQFRGQPIVLLSTAWWCGVCRREMPEVGRLLRRAKEERGVQCVVVSGDFDVALTRAWLQFHKADVNLVWAGGTTGMYTALLSVIGWPSQILIDPDFRVAKLKDPKQDRMSQLKGWIEGLPRIQ